MTEAYAALIEALVANLVAPIDVADRLTERAKRLVREVLGE